MAFVNTATNAGRALALFCAVGAAMAEQVCVYRDATCNSGAMCATLAPTAGFCQTAFGTYGILENVQTSAEEQPVYLLQVYLDVACQRRSLAITTKANECTKVSMDQPGAIPPLFVKVTPDTMSRREEPAILFEDGANTPSSSGQEAPSDFADNGDQATMQTSLQEETTVDEMNMGDNLNDRSARAAEDEQQQGESARDEQSDMAADTVENDVNEDEEINSVGTGNDAQDSDMLEQPENAVTDIENMRAPDSDMQERQIITADDIADVGAVDLDNVNDMDEAWTTNYDQDLENEIDETAFESGLANDGEVDEGNAGEMNDLDTDVAL